MTRQATPDAYDHIMIAEGCIADLQSWANALQAMGLSPSNIEAGAMSVIGRAIDDLAGRLNDHWTAIHKAVRNDGSPGKPRTRFDPDGDLQLRHHCAEVLAIKDRSNGNDLADDDIALKALTDRDHHLCREIAGTKALTALGLAAKAHVVATECGLELAPAMREPADLDDASMLIVSLLRDVLRGPASADWQRSNA